MKRDRSLPELMLTVEENDQLIGWTRRRKTSQALALRARIVLAGVQTTSNAEVVRQLKVSRHPVGK